MAWTTTVAAADVRAECPLITTALKADATVLAEVAKSEATINNVLRNKYDLTNPGADAQVLQADLFLTCASLLYSIFKPQAWPSDSNATYRYYQERWLDFLKGMIEGYYQLSLSASSGIPKPSYNNESLSDPDVSQFSIDGHHANSLELEIDD